MATTALALATTGALSGAGGAFASTTTQAPTATTPGSAAGDYTAGNYIVVLKDEAAAAYDGGVKGYAPTRPEAGAHYDATTPAARSYVRYLGRQQDAAIDAVDAKPYYRYSSGLNGFASHLSAAQASKLAADRGVLLVEKAVNQKPTATRSNPAPISGVPASGWANGYDAANIPNRGFAGRGVVIGVIDTGIWPENPSFTGRALGRAKGTTPYVDGTFTSAPTVPATPTVTGPTTAFLKSDGTYFHGLCQLGQSWTATDCNQKLISAQYFDAGYLAGPAATRSPAEFLSTRDADGHGSHTASTAGGNLVKHAVIDGHDFGAISGTAPEAKIAAYKVCFSDTDEATGDCSTADSVRAIDQAITDGVDVINYSISGSTDTVVDAVEFAFFNAALAGIFVAASAGNDGPKASTVAHPSPWLTTVAASADTAPEGTVVLGNGAKYKGASNNFSALPQTPLVLSTAIGLPGKTATDVRLCAPGSLDPAGAAGKVVLCDRGVVARTDKSAEVQRAGGVGMVLANTSPLDLDADVHSVPTVHVDDVAGAAIKAYVASTATPTAAIEVGDTTGGTPTPTPQLAGFSSRGPSLSADGGLLKPDITGPGVSVTAAFSPVPHGRDYDIISGTSMSSPYVAGLAALYFSVHSKWTPMMIKSAMMTTAYDLKNADGTANADPLQQGAGHVDPNRMLQPGLVVTSSPLEWVEYFASQGAQVIPGFEFPPLAATDINSPSIANGAVVDSITVTRTFTALLQGTYKVAVDVPGFTVDAPSSLTFTQPGQSKTLTLTFTRSDATLGSYATGSVTLTGPRVVRLPVALKPIALSAPAEVAGSGADGSVDVTVRGGETGDQPVTTAGLAAGAVTTGALAPKAHAESLVVIPEGATLARFDLDTADDTADFDLYLYPVDDEGVVGKNYVALSATGSADERITIVDPPAGRYVTVVDGYATAPGAATTAYTETNYVVTPDTTLGDLTVTPNPVPLVRGEPSTFAVSWTGLDAATPYLGWLGYPGTNALTIVSVN